MKLITFLAIIISSLVGKTAPPSHQETITRSLQFSETSADNELWLRNIQGDVTVIGYQGETVEISAEKTIEARTQERVQLGVEEIQLTAKLDSNIMLVYMDAPFIDAQRKGNHFHYRTDHHHGDWNQPKYNYRMDFTVRIPKTLILKVSTINEGTVTIENVQSPRIEARNVNGPIQATDISGQTSAVTVNGDVDISFAKAPAEDSHFKTINGDITLLMPESLSADISFKSMNGEFYTNFEQIDYLPAEVSSDRRKGSKRTTYRIDRSTKIRIGQGGPTVETETLNGEVYLKSNE
ncbi:DUF4097 family beta strand repeat-containing protein [Tunicatimonas pelagia]|uniref:DUF4097 family beta strand repeat-containing protein n=1 Tax=Tunicatimonas pelagia TaxID=931531 RepID=UPI002665559E|nr:DUF4097 family beta strand repeat-containing protein [Tunicatimonas pelagia]WKN40926.1 DUF4097 family beta strand repeat-containing protein [Tunicatimonas pelagia]